MKKKRILVTAFLLVLAGLVIWFLYQPKNINTILERLDDPFKMEEIIITTEIEKDTTVTFYANLKKKQLYNAIIRENSFFYTLVRLAGSVSLEQHSGIEDLKAGVQISWYDKSDKYVIMAVIYDDEVATIQYRDERLQEVDFSGYRIAFGFGFGDYEEYKLYDKNGNLLDHW